MKIILVRPNWPHRSYIVPPLNLGYIAAAAKQVGWECEIYDAWLKNEDPWNVAFNIIEKSPDIIGVQIFSDTVKWTRTFILQTKLFIDARIIVGGPYVTVLGDKAREEVNADTGFAGEFDNEYAMLHAVDLVNTNKYNCLTVGLTRTDVNRIPMPDWDSIDLPSYWPHLNPAMTPTRGKRIGHIQTTRGCPFHCTFCAAPAISGHKVRHRDIDNVIAEIEYLKNRWAIDELWIQDDNAIVDYKKGLELFERLIPLKLHIRLPNGIRWENISDEMVRYMKQAGVYYTGIGIESGNPRVLERIKKQLNQEWTKDAIADLARHGILTSGFFIFGLPTESRSDMKDTVRWAMNTRLHHAQFGLFLPYPGAEDEHEKSLLPNNELIKIQRNATLRFYLRPRIIWYFIRHFRWSQIRAILGHPWVKEWLGK